MYMIKTNLAVLMAERGLKIADVYEATGISKTTLMAISENTGKGIQYETIDKLCNFFNVSPEKFFVYSPYIFKFHDLKHTDSFDTISITVERANNLTSYELSMTIKTPQAYNYPVSKDDADFMLFVAPAVEEDPTKWGENEKAFYKIYDNLPTVLKSDLNNRLYKMILDNLSRLNGITLKALDGDVLSGKDLVHEVTVKNGMNVIINVFGGRFTRITKVPLFVVKNRKQK